MTFHSGARTFCGCRMNASVTLERTPMTAYRISPYVQSLVVDERTSLVGHPFFLEFSVLDGDVAAIFNALRDGAQTPDEVQQRVSAPHELVEQALEFFRARHFVLADNQDEVAEVTQRVRKFQEVHAGKRGVIVGDRTYRDYTSLQLDELKARIPFENVKDVKFLIVGGCLTQFAADALQQLASVYGIRATVEATWPDRSEVGSAGHADVFIYQPSTTWFMGPLWDDAPFLSDTERLSRLDMLKDHLRLSLAKMKAQAKGKLLLVQGFSPPLHSPLGTTEFRSTCNFYRIVNELNGVILEALRDEPNVMLIDEERILSAVGKSRLMDHSVSTFSHHAPLDFACGIAPKAPSREETFGMVQACHAPHLFAQAYLDAYLVWSGIGHIKCVIVDLDNTLWPGVAGEGGFDIAGPEAFQTFKYGAYGGIHQALKIVKERGVLLATCSRNNEADSLDAWQRLEALAAEHGLTHVLKREDFVLHRVNWESKSKNVAEIAAALGFATDAILFIDDSAIEREEVKAALPKVRTLGENLNLVRSALLSDPCLQINIQTAESAARTEMVKAQIERDADRSEATDEQTFLRKLDVRLKITRVRGAEKLPRMIELIQRTNQFNTTLARLNAAEVQEYLEDPQHAAFVLEASDRFANYGLVGACLVRENDIAVFVMSCRVIPLRPEVPFLSVALHWHGRDRMHGSIVEGPRNQPCRQLYREAGFEEVTPGEYVLPTLDRLAPVDEAVYHIERVDDSEAEADRSAA